MRKSSRTVLTGWKAVLLAPFALPVALVAGLLPGARTVQRSPGEVAAILRDFIEDTGGEWDWDDFESVAIRDPALEAIRLRAIAAGPPDPDLSALRGLLAEAERLAKVSA